MRIRTEPGKKPSFVFTLGDLQRLAQAEVRKMGFQTELTTWEKDEKYGDHKLRVEVRLEASNIGKE